MNDQVKKDSYIIKVLGKNDDLFTNSVLLIIHKYYPDLENKYLKTKMSRQKGYCSISISDLDKNSPSLVPMIKELQKDKNVILVL